jgi:LacI family transcriptional regulator
VINNSPRVKPKTAEQVRKAVAQLGLTGTGVRRGPRRRGSAGARNNVDHIAIITLGQAHDRWFQMPVMAAVISGIMREAKSHRIAIQIEETFSPDELSDALKNQHVQGSLIFLPAGADPAAMENLARQTPSVRVMGESLTLSGVDHVCPDNVAIGHMAMQYLLAHDCRECAFMATHPNWEFVRARAFGFQSAAYAGGLASPAVYLVSQDKTIKEFYGSSVRSAASIENMVEAFVSSAHRPRGLFVPRDEETVQIYRLLASHGVKPGRDVTIISCDNEETRLAGLDPRPASIEMRPMEIGRRAVRQLLSRIAHPDDAPLRLQVAPLLTATPKS